MMPLLLLLLTAATPPLEASVTHFWEALSQRNKVEAMKDVHPDDLNAFLYRTEAAFRGWKLDSIEPVDTTHARVQVSLEIQFQDRWLHQSFTDNWELVEGQWKIRIDSPEQMVIEQYQAAAAAPALPPELRLTPDVLKHYELSRSRPATLSIQNGLSTPAVVSEIQLDPELFDKPPLPVTVAPGTTEVLSIFYRGSSREANQKSRIIVTIEQDDRKQVYERPIIYNYSDRLTRWLEKLRSSRKAQPTPEPPLP